MGGESGGVAGGLEEWREVDEVLGTEYTIRGLTAFTVYELRVSALNGIGRSQPSSSVDVTTAELGNCLQAN